MPDNQEPTHDWTAERLGERAVAWIDSALDPVVCLDPSLNVVYVNPAFLDFAGCDVEACIGRRFADVSPFDGATEGVAELIRRSSSSRRREESQFISDRGGDDWVRGVSARPDFGSDGALVGYIVAVRDMTEHWRVQRTLRERETDFRTLADNSPDNIVRYGIDGVATYCNRELEDRLDVAHDRIVGRRPTDSTSSDPEQMAELERQVMRAITTGEPGRIDLNVRVRSGADQIHSILIRAERDDQGAIYGALAIGRDVTDLVRARQALADKEREFRSLAENASDNIGRWGIDGRFLYANPALEATFREHAGQMPEQWGSDHPGGQFADVAAAIRRVIDLERAETIEQRFPHPLTRTEQVHQVRLVPEHDEHGNLASVLGIGRDVTEVVRQREDLERIARTDTLTGVANRKLLYERSPAVLGDARRRGRHVGVMLLDLDGFKHVNDRFGHRAGDELLRTVASRLATCIRDDDLLVRLGGDEFVLVVNDIESRAAMVSLADRVRLALTGIDASEGAHFARVDASIGIVLSPDDGESMDVLLAHADLAMYAAKHHGRGRVEHYHAELSSAMERRAAIEQALANGDFEREFDLHLQPIYRLGDRPVIVGAEALARWVHPALGHITPDEFIPVAEECGRIVQFGRWAMRRAAELAVRCNRGRTAPLRIAVNVSTRQFALDDVSAALRHALHATGCDPEWIQLEITESLLLEDSLAVQVALDAVRSLGVAIAIDDFGMGYSALHYLARFHVDHLKIDRVFVDGIGQSDRRAELVKAFVALASALELDVVAEGIETEEQLSFLRDLGCGFGQGYLLARPMPADQFAVMLRQHDDIVSAVR